MSAPEAASSHLVSAVRLITFSCAATIALLGGGRAMAAPAAAAEATGLRAGPGGTVERAGRPYRGIGVNYFDCFLRTLKDGTDTSYAAGFAALAARDIPFARFCATGFWPKDLDLYRRDRAEYFRRLDGVVQAAERHGVGLVPSLFWHLPGVPDLVGEPMDQWGERRSRTHAWMRQYVAEVVGRYRTSPAIWAWELGNEFNLAIDLPGGATHRPKMVPALGTPATRSERDELRLEHLEVAAAEFGRAVRALDPVRLISAGHSFPRPSAWHLHAQRSWKKDDENQLTEMLARQNPAPIELLSVHVYRDDSLGRMDWLVGAARRLGRPLFIGEFGVPAEKLSPEEQRREFTALLAKVRQSGAPLAALWVYDYSRQTEWNVTATNARAWQLEAVAAANREL
jgi:sugar phosphate isomerase/epimerase